MLLTSLLLLSPPAVANRASGIAPIFSVPARSTVGQFPSAGTNRFVGVEGEIDGSTVVEAADVLVTCLRVGESP